MGLPVLRTREHPWPAHARTLDAGPGVRVPLPPVPGKAHAGAGEGERRPPAWRPTGERCARTPTDEERSARPAVLFIDDQIGPENELIWLLELEGFAVECAASGADGLARALAKPWDAIVLDLRLPDVPGLTVLERLTDAVPACPIIAITGWYLSEEYEEAALRLGASAFRFKPVDGAELADLLRGVLPSTPRAGSDTWEAECRRGDLTAAGAAPSGPAAGERASAFGFPLAGVPALHVRLRVGDGTAVAPLAEAMLPGLTHRLRRRFPQTDEQTSVEAAVDAFLAYVRRPCGFDPGRGVALEEYLFHAACREVVDRQRGGLRRRLREAEDTCRAAGQPIPAAGELLERRHDLEILLSGLTDERAVVGETERQALRLLAEAERSAEVWARVLGVGGRPADVLRREARRLKGRLLERLRRWWRSPR
jgi:CheY-like chemotaxis protein